MPAVKLSYQSLPLFLPISCHAALVNLYGAPANRVSRYTVLVRWHESVATLHFHYVVILPGDGDQPTAGTDIILNRRGGGLKEINSLHPPSLCPSLSNWPASMASTYSSYLGRGPETEERVRHSG
jgi:hypothetical protein